MTPSPAPASPSASAADRRALSRKTPSWAQPTSAYRITVCWVAGDQTERVDSWIWSVRLTRTRLAASGACRAGHVRVNGVRVKPAHAIRAGDEVRLRYEGRERVVVVHWVISKRAGAPVAAGCYIDYSPPPPSREEVVVVAARDRGTGLRASAPRRLHPRLMTTQTCNFMIEGTTTWSDTLAYRCRTIGLDMAVFGPPAGWCRGRNAARRPASPARRPAPGGHLHGSWRLREDGENRQSGPSTWPGSDGGAMRPGSTARADW